MKETTTTGWHLWDLRAGDKIRITEGGSVRDVVRVSPGAAYYEIQSDNTYDVFDKKTGLTTTITRGSKRTSYIATRSYVEMIERGPITSQRVFLSPERPEETVVSQQRPELPPIKYKRARRRRLA